MSSFHVNIKGLDRQKMLDEIDKELSLDIVETELSTIIPDLKSNHCDGLDMCGKNSEHYI
jgi:hypothetical protein